MSEAALAVIAQTAPLRSWKLGHQRRRKGGRGGRGKFFFFSFFFSTEEEEEEGKDPDCFPAFFALPSSSLAFWRKKRKKEFPSSSFLSSPMGKSRQSQRCFLCNSGEKDLRDTDQQYQGPELATLTHHEDRKACRSCQVFTVLHIKVTLSPPLQFLQPSAFDR